MIANAAVTGLFARLPSGDHELVIYDVNRFYEAQGLITKQIDLEKLISGPSTAYAIDIVTNRDSTTFDARAAQPRRRQRHRDDDELGLAWPDDVYSLAHIALPFAPDDPLYGDDPRSRKPGHPSSVVPRFTARTGVLSIPPTMT